MIMMMMIITIIKMIMMIMIINLIYVAQCDTNGILTALYIVIKYIQTQYVHMWSYMKQSYSYTYTCLHIYTYTDTYTNIYIYYKHINNGAWYCEVSDRTGSPGVSRGAE